jgi:hypothetical protein
MATSIQRALHIIHLRVDKIEEQIADTPSAAEAGCVHCGYLTDKDIAVNEQLQGYILELRELMETIDYLQDLEQRGF